MCFERLTSAYYKPGTNDLSRVCLVMQLLGSLTSAVMTAVGNMVSYRWTRIDGKLQPERRVPSNDLPFHERMRVNTSTDR